MTLYTSQAPVRILTLIKPDHIFPTQFFKIISILLPRGTIKFSERSMSSFSSVLLTDTLYALLLSLSLARALHLVHLISPFLDHPHSIW